MTNTDRRAGSSGGRGRTGSRRAVDRAMPGWVFVVAGLALGLVVFFVAQPDERLEAAPAAPEAVTVPVAEKPAEPVFDFYTSLPQRDMNTPESLSAGVAEPDKETSAAVESAPLARSPVLSVAPDIADAPSLPLEAADPDLAAQGGFLLQVGSFQLEQDAVQLQSRLASSGLAATVAAVDIPNTGRWYRVRVGPYNSRELALADRQKLTRLGVDSLVISRK